MHGRSRMTKDPRIPTMPGRQDGARRVFTDQTRHSLHQARSAVRCSASRTKGELHPTNNRLRGVLAVGDSFNALFYFPVCPLPETAFGVHKLYNCLVGALP